MADRSIAQTLVDMGYAHRPLDGAPYGKRQIFHVESGEIVGFYDAGNAINAALGHDAIRYGHTYPAEA